MANNSENIFGPIAIKGELKSAGSHTEGNLLGSTETSNTEPTSQSTEAPQESTPAQEQPIETTIPSNEQPRGQVDATIEERFYNAKDRLATAEALGDKEEIKKALKHYEEASAQFFGVHIGNEVSKEEESIDRQLKKYQSGFIGKAWVKLGDINLEKYLVKSGRWEEELEQDAGFWDKAKRALARGVSARNVVLAGLFGAASASAASMIAGAAGMRMLRAVGAGATAGIALGASELSPAIAKGWDKKILDQSQKDEISNLDKAGVDKLKTDLGFFLRLRGEKPTSENPLYRALIERDLELKKIEETGKTQSSLNELTDLEQERENLVTLLGSASDKTDIEKRIARIDQSIIEKQRRLGAQNRVQVMQKEVEGLFLEKCKLMDREDAATDEATKSQLRIERQKIEATMEAKAQELLRENEKKIEITNQDTAQKSIAANNAVQERIKELDKSTKKQILKAGAISLVFGGLTSWLLGTGGGEVDTSVKAPEGAQATTAVTERAPQGIHEVVRTPEQQAITQLATQESRTPEVMQANLDKLGHTAQEYSAYRATWQKEVDALQKLVDLKQKISLQEWEHLRNISSWQGTKMGDDAASLLEKVQSEKLLDPSIKQIPLFKESPTSSHQNLLAGLTDYAKLHMKEFPQDWQKAGPDEVAKQLVKNYLESHSYLSPEASNEELTAMLSRLSNSHIGEVWISPHEMNLMVVNDHLPLGFREDAFDKLFPSNYPAREYISAIDHAFFSPENIDTGRAEFMGTLAKPAEGETPSGYSAFMDYYEKKFGPLNVNTKAVFDQRYNDLISKDPTTHTRGEEFFKRFYNRIQLGRMPSGQSVEVMNQAVVEQGSGLSAIAPEPADEVADRAARAVKPVVASGNHQPLLGKDGLPLPPSNSEQVHSPGLESGAQKPPAPGIVTDEAIKAARLPVTQEYLPKLQAYQNRPEVWNNRAGLQSVIERLKADKLIAENLIAQGGDTADAKATEANVNAILIDTLGKRLDELPVTPVAAVPKVKEPESLAEFIQQGIKPNTTTEVPKVPTTPQAKELVKAVQVNQQKPAESLVEQILGPKNPPPPPPVQ